MSVTDTPALPRRRFQPHRFLSSWEEVALRSVPTSGSRAFVGCSAIYGHVGCRRRLPFYFSFRGRASRIFLVAASFLSSFSSPRRFLFPPFSFFRPPKCSLPCNRCTVRSCGARKATFFFLYLATERALCLSEQGERLACCPVVWLRTSIERTCALWRLALGW